ncbi:Glycosyl transferase, group 1 [Fulvivirga imtechensis AK7]|uniref:Glycosyl transferase, group 1 n=1 Tax=Fulvivirga imtechensis AK7 TaxID=1237149 RepID=L8JTI9_9BACT|nr:glycosyltransferase family 1 protein [Fulvivirga imtechensis]ELR72286.1 Glycosyl transferase, group 1 [Fulvivirga imtechensis AK7]
MKKKIIVNALNLHGNFSGVHYYIKNLLEELDGMELPYEIAPLFSKECSINNYQNLRPIQVSFKSSYRSIRIFYENFHLPKYFESKAFNLYHSTSYVLPYKCRFPSLTTVHDLISLDYPDLCKTSTALYYGSVIKRSITNSLKIITVSKKVKADILERFDLPPDKVEVIPLGVSPKFRKVTDTMILDRVKKFYKLPERFILFTGNLEPKKNLVRLIKAFTLFKIKNANDYQLVIIGQKAWKYGKIFEAAKKSPFEKEIHFLGYVNEHDLPVLYSLAKLFVFPSIYEGFGLPALEALACETPTLVSSAGALPEITGNYCPIINPFSIEDISFKISSACEGKLPYDIKTAAHWASQFTWKESAIATANVYSQLL